MSEIGRKSKGDGKGEGEAYFVVPFREVVHVLVMDGTEGVFCYEIDDAGDALEEAL